MIIIPILLNYKAWFPFRETCSQADILNSRGIQSKKIQSIYLVPICGTMACSVCFRWTKERFPELHHKGKSSGRLSQRHSSKHIASTLSSMQKDNFRLQAPWKFPGLQLEQLWLRTLPEILASVLSGLRHPKPGRIKLCTSISVPTDSSLEKTIWNWWSCVAFYVRGHPSLWGF